MAQLDDLMTVTQDEALVVLLVQEAQEAKFKYLGRTALQKLCYFAQSLDVPLSYRFQIYFYGPYAEALTFDVDLLIALNLLHDASSDPKRYSNFMLGQQGPQALDAYRSLLGKYRPIIRNVVRSFKDLGPDMLELLSTLHFIDRRLRARGGPAPNKKQILAEFQEVKGQKFSLGQVEDAYEAMQRVGLLGR